VADVCSAALAREGAVTVKTHEDQNRAWRRWVMWAESVGLGDDIFLDGFERADRIKLMGAFAMALREGRFSGQAHDSLAEGTVRNSISYVASSFRDSDRSNPTLDEDGNLGRLLSHQFRAFKNKDPPPKQQKLSPASSSKSCSTKMQQNSSEH